MNTKNLVVNDHRESQEIKHVCKEAPDIRISIFALAFRVETIGLGHAPRLVVPSNQIHTERVPQFQANEQGDGLHAEETAIDVVSQKEVIGVWAIATDAEDLLQVEKLAMDIADHGDGRFDVYDIALFDQ